MEYNCATCAKYHDAEDDECFKTCENHSSWTAKTDGCKTRNDCQNCAQKVVTEDGMVGCKCPRPHHCNECTCEEQERFYKGENVNATAKLDGENVSECQTMSKQMQDIPLVDKTNAQDWIVLVCDEIKELLLSKNRKYGDSALNPCRVFAKADNIEQLNVRIDDKLNRIRNRQNDEDEDVELDLIGYLILKRIAKLTNK